MKNPNINKNNRFRKFKTNIKVHYEERQKSRIKIRELKRQKKENVDKMMTFSKKLVVVMITVSIIWISLSYVLAFMGKNYIAESLSQTVVTVIVATILGYLCKAFFETYAEEKNKLKDKELDLQNNNEPEIIIEDEALRDPDPDPHSRNFK